MSLEHLGFIELPESVGPGGFDHAAVHGPRGLLYVAHTANDAVDVIDIRQGRYLRSIANLKAVAGALVDQGKDLVFTSNRGEDTVSVFSPDAERQAVRIKVGAKPNGLAFDPDRGLLLCANVGESPTLKSHTVSIVDVASRSVLQELPVPGRTRWTVFDPDERVFFVNIADPARIAIIDPTKGGAQARWIEVPARGPHGLDLDAGEHRLYCACDDATLVCLDSRSGAILGTLELSGAPDVICLNRARGRLYVAIGDPGVIDVVDVSSWRHAETVKTAPGAHTIAFDPGSDRVYAFLPDSHRASVHHDVSR